MDETSALLKPDDASVIPRLKLGEIGVSGLRVTNKSIQDEANRLFRFPYFLSTIEEMSNNPTVAAALSTYNIMIGPRQWRMEVPAGASDALKERAKFAEQCLHDMDVPWGQTVTEILSFLSFGFSVHEIVLRRRLKRNGSKYNDGLVGIKALPIRSQKTLTSGWIYSEDGRELIAVDQDLTTITDQTKYTAKTNEFGKLRIPREKFLLFRCDGTKGNPEGRSILKSCYSAYKQLTLVEDQELLGLTRDLQGIPLIELPPEYMSPDASEAQKAVYASSMKMIDGLATGSQAGIVFPIFYDEKGNQLFKVSLLESKGTKNFDTSKIIARKQDDVLMALHCDLIKLGSGDSSGSFSLASAKTSMLALAISYRLKEIQDVIKEHLLRVLFEANGWDTEILPTPVCDDFDNIDIDELSKYLQRCKATGLLEVDRDLLNLVRTSIGLKPRPDDEPVSVEELNLGQSDSRSGDSLNTPSGGQNGTSKSVSKKDNSIANKENA